MKLERLKKETSSKWKNDWPENCIHGESNEPIPFHIPQQLIWDSPRRILAMIAGSQGGKTSFGPWWLEREIEQMGGGDHLAVTASFDLFKLKMLPTMLNVFEHILGIGRYWTGDKIIEIKDPRSGLFLANKATDRMWARIILRSADALGGLESATAGSAWLDECGQDRFTRQAYQAVRRRLAIKRGRILMTTTLYNLGWIVDTVIDRAISNGTSVLGNLNEAEYEVVDNEKDNIYLVQFDSTVNPSFSTEEFDEQKENMSEEDFNMFYRGRKATYRSMIYNSFDRHTHTCNRFSIPADWPRYIGVDFGGTHMAAVFYAEKPDTKELYCYREYLQGKMDIEDHVKVILQGESGKPVCYGGASGEDQWRREFSKHGLTVFTPTLTSVDLGINRVYAQHKANGIIYFKDLDGIINEKLKYRRKMDGNNNITPEIENKNAFHLLDAERYIISEIRPGVTQRAKVLRLGV